MKRILIIIGLLAQGLAYGQESKTIDFLSEIKKYDISDLWTLRKFRTLYEGDTSWIERREPLGYIGENYQRFYIHFISVIQNPNNKLEYFVYGKTRVKSNICSFQGLIKVKESKTYTDVFPAIKQGYVKGDYEFYEDSDQKGTGILKGKFRTDFFIDKSSEIKYNALSFIADGFKNNQFEGTWTSYKSKDSKKCNCGDCRIPDSRDLDAGAAEFGTAAKYDDFGWKYYNLAWGYKLDRPGVKEAREKETEK